MIDFSFCYTKNEEKESIKVIESLKKLGYSFNVNDVDMDKVIIISLTIKSKLDDILSSYNWLEEQFDYSSTHYLKLMPFFIYDSTSDDPEESFDKYVGEIYETIFSGEFKPYCWNLNSKNPEIEFKRVLEQYSE